ncbi:MULTISPECIES: RNA methyltransferase [Solibacillus]|uniref:RNA methyltransferase n=1 Tax=Solibacillus merdavium TaxID=2762218 RepID=A0ABR8XIV3_9BACL|nr:RNA methyltransferase [Solibacillus merdavium]MBD8031856.1 RNA methyltransferase [Solibacillus merdavium]
MRKLFPINNKLQISSFLDIRYDGSYTLGDVSPTEYNCHTKDFTMHIRAGELEVMHLFEEGFLIHCKKLEKLSIERIKK